MDFTPILTEPVAIVLLAVLAASFIYLMVHYGVTFFHVGHWHLMQDDKHMSKSTPSPDELEEDASPEPVMATDRSVKSDDRRLPPVSVIMTAHNDAEWLRENIVYLLEQDYPNFEVVVVDYVSHDDTQFVLKLCSENYSHLKVVPFPADVNMFRGKKYPLSIGIKSAKHDILLFADPDCVPKDFNWIREMVSGYDTPEKQIVLGYSGIKQEKTLLNWMQVYDNMVYNVSFLSSAIHGRPYTGCGRNLSYRRSFFFRQGAFISHYRIAEGADDMFVNQNARKDNTSVVLTSGSYVMSEAQKTFVLWHRFRRCRTATRRFYSASQKLALLLPPLSLLLFYVATVLLIVLKLFPWQIIVGVLAVKFAWQIVSVYQSVRRLGVKKVHWFSPFFELYFLFANTFLFFTPLSNNKK